MKYNWKNVTLGLPKQFGHYIATVIPRNDCDVDSQNSWRKSFGCTKVWFNGGKWYEANRLGYGNEDITEFVTHWDEMPTAPILTEKFIFNGYKNWQLTEYSTSDIESMAITEYQKTSNNCAIDCEDYVKGFVAAFLKINGSNNK